MSSTQLSFGTARSHPAFIVAVCAIASLTMVSACSGVSSGTDEDYPSQTVTMVVPYEAGASADNLARKYTELLGDELGVSVVVENRDGGSGTVGTSAVVEAEPDGYTIGYGHNSPLAIQVQTNTNLPYSTPEDYTPIGGIGSQPATLAVRTDSPWTTFEEFVEAARKNPGKHTIAVGGAGNVKDLQLREFENTAKVDFNITPFSGGGSEAVTATLGGQTDAVAVNPSSVSGVVESNDLRVLTVFTDKKFDQFDTATIREAGYKNVRILQDSSGVIAPAGLPTKVSETLQKAHSRVVSNEKFKETLAQQSYTYEPLDNKEYAQAINTDLKVFGELVKE